MSIVLRSIPVGCSTLLLSALLACADSSAPDLTAEPRAVRRVRAAQAHNMNGSWASITEQDRIVAVREVMGRLGDVRVRVFAYDSTGRLRDFSERRFRVPDGEAVVAADLPDLRPLPVDSVSFLDDNGDYLRTAIVFRADVAVLTAGQSGNAPVVYSRRELKDIMERAGLLYDAAIRGGSGPPPAQSAAASR